ncbi:endoplasmic reticulum membrane sensor NFE2L1-like [Pseudoliparis swirei]|uniref:endoplasmic reticulum membrane sensor NFE2L1-like n=1 Tax=Pseudoliparis swirei TaxID=2059687 RepID=UPI0024BEA6BB|nr:endoplasmic reticulum membrane sensor NFE2L1-like [Pseudoliparis swirei]XP_056263609.1 endoplasmic reticulum membrane sensor NFE2L1-like [Pseudoliparis swirei]XP_056263610.1 endoplasmic reticulum membrane sensor NFE2L1-like [Pseudoliparis swirei]
MLQLKKYLTEGLIQMAILLSLRIDVGMDPYLPPSLHQMILGPTSVLTQTQFHNRRNRLGDGQELHPKSVDLDDFFTTRRLLGWVHSLDRLQVPQAELETWLVQREPDPLPIVCPDLLERAPAEVERGRTAPPVEPRAGLGTLRVDEEEEDKEEETHHECHHSGALEEPGEEEEEEEHLGCRTEGRGGGSFNCDNIEELTPNEGDQTLFSLQECFRLLEETYDVTEEPQLHDVGGIRGDLGCQPPGREPLSAHITPTGNPSLELELHWQDLLAILDPENTNVDMLASFDEIQNSRSTETLQGVGSEVPRHDDSVTEAELEVDLTEHGLLGPPRPSEREPALLPLTPSAELDDHISARDTLKSSHVNPSQSLPDHTHLLAQDPSEDFYVGINADDHSSTLNMNLLTHGLVDTMEGSPCSRYAPHPNNLPSFDANFRPRDLTPSSFTPSPEWNGMTRDPLTSLPGFLLVDEEEGVNDEVGLPSPLCDLLEDDVILDEMRLLDLALDEGFSPEMAARLEEEGFLRRETGRQETGRDVDHSGSDVAITEDQPRRHQQDGPGEADSDSGLSLDFSRSPASPCASEAFSYSSSSTSSSSCTSAVGSPFTEDEDEDTEEGLLGSDMEVTIKQEALEEEEMGAVGGGYPEDVKKPFPPNDGDHKLYNGVSGLEHIGHDHTYDQPWSSSPSHGKMSTKSSLRHDDAKPYHRSPSRHISETKMWSRDERRARSRKIPFSIEGIVDLPVEEFNELLGDYQLSEEQLVLIRDIRRRGKNKIAAQNCRKRKLDVLYEMEDDVTGLRRHHSRLLREKQEALRNLQEMKRQLGTLYQDVFSRLRDEEGMPLNATEYLLDFESDGTVSVASRHQQREALPLTKTSRKQRDKKK